MLKKLFDLKYFIAVFIMLELLSFSLLDRYFSSLKREHLTESAERLRTEYRAVFNSYSLLSRTLFSEAISRPDIIEIFKDAYPADETKRKLIRGRLFRKTNPIFQKLKQEDFKLLQFHLPDGTSFLRVHKPDEFGDNLSGFRYSVKLVNTEKRYIEGFEQGRIYSGFRFIFPLAYKDLHIGSVETAISFNGLRKEMEKLFPSDYLLIVKQDSVLKKIFKDEQTRYMKSDISNEYMYEISEMGTDADKRRHLQKEILQTIAGRTKDKISEDIKNEKIFAIYAKAGKVGSGHYVVSFLPVKNFDGTTGAYIISFEKDTTITEYERNYYIILILATLLLLALLTFAYVRKLNENSLRTLNERLQALINGSPLSIVIIDTDGNLLLWNPAAEKTFGWTKEEVLGRPLPIVPDNKKEEHTDFRQKALRGESIKSWETVRKRKDGSMVPVALSTAPMHDEKGNVAAIMGIIEDITERKQAEKDMVSAKQMLEDITDGITESILLLSKDFKVVWANKASLKQTGLSIKELVGNYCYKATHARECPCEPPEDPCPVCKLMETGNPTIEEHIHYDKNGERLFVEVSAYPVKDGSGKIVQFVHIAKDITERKRLEQEREKLIHELKSAVDEVKTLSGLLPICSSCKKIRDDKGYWNQIEVYIRKHSEAEFTHSICPECAKKIYPEYYDRIFGEEE
ncbi:MAG: PAS domain S-box protein [Nitrospirae bacterium]|nr:MAG: PAS domain S-box protein [Nitrospirota bacterium]